MKTDSPPLKNIIVLFHEKASTKSVKKYEISLLADQWRKQGHKVRFVFGTSQRVDGDICFVHVDLSRVPKSYLQYARRFPVVINGQVSDITKSSFSKIRVKNKQDYSGPVIVKSNLNHGGWPEAKNRFPMLLLTLVRAFQKFGVKSLFPISQADYRIYDRCNLVPDRYFKSPEHIVEQLITEKEGDLFCLNIYKFLGDFGSAERLYAKSPIITGFNPIGRDFIDTPSEIRKIQKDLHLDYGKLDYVLRDGKIVLLDVNKTIGITHRRISPEFDERTRARAKGLFETPAFSSSRSGC